MEDMENMTFKELYRHFIGHYNLEPYEALRMAIEVERNKILRKATFVFEKKTASDYITDDSVIEEELLLKHFRKPTFDEANDQGEPEAFIAEYWMFSEILIHLQTLYKVKLKQKILKEALTKNGWKYEGKRVINKRPAKWSGDDGNYGDTRYVYVVVPML